ncbi:MAG: enoyl-CoA hydratase/isomerase family protein [Dehalococcoidia bacterium]|nr:enoyl-CoA hydratase/isomerase family protein [Dehalococcoidia bacterium]
MPDRIVHMEAAIFEQRGPIAIVTLNRPEAKNSLNTAMHRDVVWAWDEINANPEIRVGIVTGAGDRAFCAGRDIKEFVDFYGDKSATKVRPIDDPNDPMFGKLCNHYIVRKPLIAAINGYAVGGGLEIVMMTDLRVMADDTYIADLHAKVNVFGMNCLAYELPWPVANYLTMANGRLSAQEALHYGFVNRVVPRERLMPTALELAEMVLTSGPDSLRHLKEGSVRRQIESGNLFTEEYLERRRREALQRVKATAESHDLMEGMKAFLEKRQASYERPS